jgi:hypothetical protein
MRGNGLSADAYVAIADLDRTTADLLLAELRSRGVAAYAADSPEPGPAGQVDRLYVDAAAEAKARSMIDEQLAASSAAAVATQPPATEPMPLPADGGVSTPEGSVDFDAAFADIVAGFDSPGAAVGMWPAGEDLSPTPPQSPTTGPFPGPTVGWDDVLRPQQPAPAQPPAPGPADQQDRYVPPPPPPLPHPGRRTVAAWAAVTGGPAVLFAAAIFGWQLDNLLLLVAAVAFLAGFVTLVAGLRDDDGEDDGDDGAVV